MRLRWLAMNTGILAVLLVAGVAGCATRSWDMFKPTEPEVAAKLKLTEEEWRTIQALAAQEQGWVPYEVLRREKRIVEIDFRKPADPEASEGGIVRRYEKAGDTWRKSDYESTWSYMLAPLPDEKKSDEAAAPAR